MISIVRDEDSNKHYVAALHYENEAGSKTDNDLTNEYDSGSLTVTKHVAGNMADMGKKFTFTITFNAGTADWENAIVVPGENWDAAKRVYTVELGNGESVTFTNIPKGVTYTVEEADYTGEGYTTTKVTSDGFGTIEGGDNDTVDFTNTKTATVDTGIALDSLPYVLLLAVACVGMAVVLTRKRRED